MKIRKSIILFPILFFLAGCAGKHFDRGTVCEQVDVFGIQLFSDRDYKEINGVKADEEPCLRGYERTFDALDLTIGYGFDKKIRKITTRNPGTILFGINPGMSFRAG